MVINDKIKELKDLLNVDDSCESETVSIISDKKQYSVRIPKRFVDAMKIDSSKDEFEFTLDIPQDYTQRPKLFGRVVSKK